MTDEPKRWLPNTGWNDIASWSVTDWDIGKIALHGAYEMAHRLSQMQSIYSLAIGACLGRERPKLVEIGTQYGQSTRALLTAARRYNGHLTSYDIDPECNQGELAEWVEKHRLGDAWTFICGKSQDAVPLTDIDFLLVDGDHGYEAVCQDMALHGPNVREGGIIVLDDYHLSHLGKVRWIQERWTELRPIVFGPWAVIQHRKEYADIYRKVCPTPDGLPPGSWKWNPVT